jgi:two-component system, NtrC family, sensor kinase
MMQRIHFSDRSEASAEFLGNNRILVVDDEPGVILFYSNSLLPESQRCFVSPEVAFEKKRRILLDLDSRGPAPDPTQNKKEMEFHVDFAQSGAKGLELVEQSIAAGKPYATIFLDIRMPEMNGITCAEKISALDPQVRIVFLSGYSDYSFSEIKDRVPSTAQLLVKPITSMELIQCAQNEIHAYNKALRM